MHLHGNISGLKPNHIKKLFKLYQRKIPTDEIISIELSKEICSIASELHRQIGVLADRKGHISHVIIGDSSRLVIPCTGENILSSGRLKGLRLLHVHLKGEGLSKEDSYLLKQAAVHYEIAGEMLKAHECRAMAGIFDGRYREAGEEFRKAGQIGRAIDAYWRGRLWKEIADCALANSFFTRLPQCRLASFIIGNSNTVRECRSLLEQILESAKINEELRIDLRSELWKDGLQEAVQKSVGSKDKAKAVSS